MGEDLSRRDLIRHSSTGIVTVGIAGFAGCTGSIPFVGDDYDSEPIGNWLVDPSFEELLDTNEYEGQYEDFEFSEATRSDVSFESTNPDAVFDHADELTDYGQLEGGSVSQLRSRVGTPASELDWQLSQSLSWDWEYTHTEQSTFGEESEATEQSTTTATVDVITGSFEPDEIEDVLESWAEDDLTDEGQYEGYDFYETASAAFAVSSDAIIQTETDGDGIELLELLERVIDANAEGSDRLTADDDADDLLSQFDQGHLNSGQVLGGDMAEIVEDGEADEDTDWNTGLVGFANADAIDGETTDVSTVFLFESERYAVAEDVEEHVRRNRDIGDEFPTLEDYSVEEDGRTVTVTGTVQTQAYL